MSYLQTKRLVGVVLTVWFFLWAITFLIEPERAINKQLALWGITPITETVMFLCASFLAGTFTLLNWRWNIIIFIPYIMHTSALIFIKLTTDYAPIEAILLRLVLFVLLLIEMHRDWTRGTKWNIQK